MSKGDSKKEKKENYFGKVHELAREFKKILVVQADNVTSTQLHHVRRGLRGNATMLMGKNTLIRKALREIVEEIPELEAIFPYIKGNVGLVFTNDDLKKIRGILTSNWVPAPARVGAVAQKDIRIQAGNTGIGVEKTPLFQALGISTKVVRQAVEIINDVLLVAAGQKVGPSEAELLGLLKITPFEYGLTVVNVYDEGSIYSPSILDISDDVLIKKLMEGISNVAAVSLAIGYPTVASVPHSIVNAYKNILAISLASKYSFPAAEKLKQILANPSAFAAPVAAAPAAEQKNEAAAVEEEKEESDEEMGFSLFD